MPVYPKCKISSAPLLAAGAAGQERGITVVKAAKRTAVAVLFRGIYSYIPN